MIWRQNRPSSNWGEAYRSLIHPGGGCGRQAGHCSDEVWKVGSAAPGGGRDVFTCQVGGEMKQLIEDIVSSLVDQPDQVEIKEVIGDHAHVLELTVAKEDLGKVIGKGGAHASAIRTLMAAASGKEKKRYILEIIEY